MSRSNKRHLTISYPIRWAFEDDSDIMCGNSKTNCFQGKGKVVTYWLNGERTSPPHQELAHVKQKNRSTSVSCTPGVSIKKEFPVAGKGLNSVGVMQDSNHRRDEADVPLLSITSPHDHSEV